MSQIHVKNTKYSIFLKNETSLTKALRVNFLYLQHFSRKSSTYYGNKDSMEIIFFSSISLFLVLKKKEGKSIMTQVICVIVKINMF